MQYCKHCNEEKPISAFYKHMRSECKECAKVRVRSNRLKNIEYYREYDRLRASNPDRIAARDEYSKTKNYKISHIKANNNYIKNNPLKSLARNIFSSAIRDKKLSKEPCLICGNHTANGHHFDYKMPINVVWLCDKHHKDAHVIANEIHRQMDMVLDNKISANG